MAERIEIVSPIKARLENGAELLPEDVEKNRRFLDVVNKLKNYINQTSSSLKRNEEKIEKLKSVLARRSKVITSMDMDCDLTRELTKRERAVEESQQQRVNLKAILNKVRILFSEVEDELLEMIEELQLVEDSELLALSTTFIKPILNSVKDQFESIALKVKQELTLLL